MLPGRKKLKLKSPQASFDAWAIGLGQGDGVYEKNPDTLDWVHHDEKIHLPVFILTRVTRKKGTQFWWTKNPIESGD